MEPVLEAEAFHFSNCIFCYKKVYLLPNSCFEDKKFDEQQIGILKRFFTSIFRHLKKTGNRKDWKNHNWMLFLLASSLTSQDDDFGSTTTTQTMQVCEHCMIIVEKFCDLYHQMKCVELRVNWQIDQLWNVMKCADKIPSRLQQFKEAYKINENRGTGKLGSFRRNLKRQCKIHQNHNVPRVVLSSSLPKSDPKNIVVKDDLDAVSTPDSLNDMPVLELACESPHDTMNHLPIQNKDNYLVNGQGLNARKKVNYVSRKSTCNLSIHKRNDATLHLEHSSEKLDQDKGIDPLRCAYCGKKFRLFKTLNSHVSICVQKPTGSSQINPPEKIITKPKLPGKNWKNKYSDSATYGILNAKHGRGEHTCIICLKIFPERCYLATHFASCHPELLYTSLKRPHLTESQFQAYVNYVLHQHVSTFTISITPGTKKTMFKCTFCSKRITNIKGTARQHLVVKHCDVVAEKLQELQQNMSPDDVNLRLSEDANPTITSTAAQAPVITCQVCSIQFYRKNQLKFHQICLHPETFFDHLRSKDVTNDQFKMYVNHLFNAEEKPFRRIKLQTVAGFKCPYCSKFSTQRVYARDHAIQRHSEILCKKLEELQKNTKPEDLTQVTLFRADNTNCRRGPITKANTVKAQKFTKSDKKHALEAGYNLRRNKANDVKYVENESDEDDENINISNQSAVTVDTLKSTPVDDSQGLSTSTSPHPSVSGSTSVNPQNGTKIFRNFSQKYKCDLCGACCLSKKTLRQHMKRKHTYSFTCSICSKVFSNKSLLTSHNITFHRETFFLPLKLSCVSNHEFERYVAYLIDSTVESFRKPNNEENDNNNEAAKYECKFCPRQFVVRRLAIAHVITIHRTIMNTNLEKLQQDMKPEEVPSVARKTSLVSNFSGASSVKHGFSSFQEHPCTVCLKKFSGRGKLQIHVCTYHPEEESAFTACGENDSKSLQYKCPHCPKQLVSKASFQPHILQRHYDVVATKIEELQKNMTPEDLEAVAPPENGNTPFMTTVAERVMYKRNVNPQKHTKYATRKIPGHFKPKNVKTKKYKKRLHWKSKRKLIHVDSNNIDECKFKKVTMEEEAAFVADDEQLVELTDISFQCVSLAETKNSDVKADEENEPSGFKDVEILKDPLEEEPVKPLTKFEDDYYGPVEITVSKQEFMESRSLAVDCEQDFPMSHFLQNNTNEETSFISGEICSEDESPIDQVPLLIQPLQVDHSDLKLMQPQDESYEDASSPPSALKLTTYRGGIKSRRRNLDKQSKKSHCTCPTCGFKLTQKCNLRRHETTYHAEKYFVSVKSPNVSPDQFKKYTFHLVNTEVDKCKEDDIFKCTYCSKIVSDKSSTKIHMVIQHFTILCTKLTEMQHTMDPEDALRLPDVKVRGYRKKFKVYKTCSYCNRRFKSAIGLGTHKRFCSKSHQQTINVTKGLTKSCKFCSKSFSNNFRTRKHEATQHEEKLFASSKSLAELSSKQLKQTVSDFLQEEVDLCKNVSSDGGTKPIIQYRCNYCYTQLCTQSYTRIHLLMKHSQILVNKIDTGEIILPAPE